MRFWRGTASRVYKANAEAPPELSRHEDGCEQVTCDSLMHDLEFGMMIR